MEYFCPSVLLFRTGGRSVRVSPGLALTGFAGVFLLVFSVSTQERAERRAPLMPPQFTDPIRCARPTAATAL